MERLEIAGDARFCMHTGVPLDYRCRNTAHAFVDRMQAHLRIPLLNMLDEAMAQIASRYAGRLVGLLAPSGTVESGVYAAAAVRAGLQIMLPDDEHQAW